MRVTFCPVVAALLVLLIGAAAHGPEVSFLGRRAAPGRVLHYPNLSAKPVRSAQVATVSVFPTFLCNMSGTFQVSWSGVSNPLATDFIAIYAPADTDFNNYLDWINVTSSNTWANGNGTTTVSLLNMRVPYQFLYFSDQSKEYVHLASSNYVAVCDMPLQAHLSLTGDPTEMRIMWISNTTMTPIVRYGTSAENLNSVVDGSSHTYTADDMCSDPANIIGARTFRDVGYIHDVLMTDLVPNTRYYYQFGSGKQASEVLYFQSAPKAAPQNDVSFITYGDMGDGVFIPAALGTASNIQEHALADDYDFVLHVGDISYARSIGWIWELFLNLIMPTATRVPYMVGIGNHEYDYIVGGQEDPSGAGAANGFHPSWGNFGNDSKGECGRPMFERFHMPENGNSLFWYSFNYGNVHITHMSTEHDFTKGSEQYQWLENDLASVDRAVTPWVIFAGHRPMYTSENYTSDDIVANNIQIQLEDVLHTHEVDLAIYGHFHAYERTCQMYNYTCVPGGTVHIVVGTAGASLDDPYWFPNDWSLFHAMEFGYGRVTTTTGKGVTNLKWEFITNANDTTVDSVVLTKFL